MGDQGREEERCFDEEVEGEEDEEEGVESGFLQRGNQTTKKKEMREMNTWFSRDLVRYWEGEKSGVVS